MRPDLSRYAPPGLSLEPERWVFTLGTAGAVLYSFGFVLRFFGARSQLYENSGTLRLLRADAVMPDFGTLLGGALLGFALLALVMLGFVAYHYAYHRQGSRSIYLMRRLPDRWELHRRCWTLPLLAALACLLLTVLLFFLYFGLYMAATPDECLTPHQWQKLWSVIR